MGPSTGRAPPRRRPQPARAAAQRDGEAGATDFYSYRYLASEGFLPGYSFPRLPLAAYIPARRGAKLDGDYLQRPRFLAISEFGPGALIYHEGARYEVTRIQLPRDPERPGTAARSPRPPSAARTAATTTPVQVGTDMCEHCGRPLGTTEYGLLRLQTVFTRRRERISSDEEERRAQRLRARGLVPVRRPRRPTRVHRRARQRTERRRRSSS